MRPEHWLYTIPLRLRSLFRWAQADQEVDEELRDHLERKTEEYVAQGMTQEEAHRRARLDLGGIEQTKEKCRDARRLNWIQDFVQDLRFGLRVLRKAPGFTTVAVLTLALGIGATTAIFTVVNAVLLRPLPYPEPDRIVSIALLYKGQLGTTEFSAKQFEFWKAHSDLFQHLAATVNVGFNLGGVSTPERIKALRVSADYFQVFGVHPALGREFLPEEDRIGGPDVAILSHDLWVRDFGASPEVIGRKVTLDGAPFTVVGVTPSGFGAMSPVDLWTTIGQVASSMGSGGNYEVIARLKPTFSRGQAASYMATLAKPYLKEFAPEYLGELGNFRFAAFPYNYMLTSDVREPLAVLFGAVGLVLLIACVNVANIQMARASARTREVAVRAALGAARSRILRQLLTENLLLGLLGASGGLFLAYLGLSTFLPLVPADLPHAQSISLDTRAVAFTALVAILAGILFGIVPSFQTSRVNLDESLKESGARGISSRHRAGSALVAMEVGLSLVLLVGSGLLIKTFTNLLRTSPGFDPRDVLSVPIWTTGTRYKSAKEFARFYNTGISRVNSIPGVESSGVVAGGLPLEHGGNSSVRVLGQKDSEGFQAEYREISPEYFRTLKIPLLQGRFFTEADSQTTHRVAIINETFAREHFPARRPVGASLSIGDARSEIVAVVGDVKTKMNEPALATFFVPLAQVPLSTHRFWEAWFPTYLLVRTAQNPLSLSRAVEDALRASDPNLAIGQVRSMEKVLSLSIAFQRFLMTLMAIFAGLALALACIGLFGVISYSVSRRTHELGIRMTLGATRRDILVGVLRQGLEMTIIGTAMGQVGAVGLSRLLRSVLFGVTPNDPRTLIGVSVILISVSVLASYFPARRATRVDPMVALRYE
jgi:predicted permease